MNLTEKKIFWQKLCELSDKGSLTYAEGETVAPYTTFKIGGKADLIIKVLSRDALAQIVGAARRENVKFCVIGNGSNVLFPDEQYDGAVIVTTGINSCLVDGNRIIADCGYSFTSLAVQAQKAGLTGLEFAYGIPGSVGGAVYMNAGAYDGEISFVVKKTFYYDSVNDTLGCFEGDENHFGYRESVYQERDGLIILGAEFLLKKGDKDAISEKMQGFMNARREKQPLEYPSAGSTFKRAPGHYTGKLIQDAGMKGYSVGGAQVSEKHAGFVINKGGATSSDVKELVSRVKKAVLQSSGVSIECEIRIIE